MKEKNYTIYYRTRHRGVSNKINCRDRRDLAEAFYMGLKKSLRCSECKMLDYDTTVEDAFSTKKKIKPSYETKKEKERSKKEDGEIIETEEEEGEGNWIALTFKTILDNPQKRYSKWKTKKLAYYHCLGYTAIDREAGGGSTQFLCIEESHLESDLIFYLTIRSLVQKNFGLITLKRSTRVKWEDPWKRGEKKA